MKRTHLLLAAAVTGLIGGAATPLVAEDAAPACTACDSKDKAGCKAKAGAEGKDKAACKGAAGCKAKADEKAPAEGTKAPAEAKDKAACKGAAGCKAK